jgi:predicted dithiol-disulfide oxidoreductase (DUF899 family)
MSTQTKTFEGKKYLLDHEIVSPEDWVARRKELLKKEKEFTPACTHSRAGRLPMIRVDPFFFLGLNVLKGAIASSYP